MRWPAFVVSLVLAGCRSQPDIQKGAALFDAAVDQLSSSDEDGCPKQQMDHLQVSYGAAVTRCRCLTDWLKANTPDAEKNAVADIGLKLQRHEALTQRDLSAMATLVSEERQPADECGVYILNRTKRSRPAQLCLPP